MEKSLTIGNVYKIRHKTKGVFVGQLIEIVEAWPGDEYDTVFLTMKYDVRAGTDQVGLAITPGKDQVRVSNLRPSKILKIAKYEGESWLRNVKVPEEERAKKEEAPGEKINWFKKTFFGGN